MTHDLTFAGLTAKPGEIAKQYFVFQESKYKIPMAIINGKKDGKIFLVTASIHGFEFPGIQAAVELIRELNPEEMSGAMVIIPVVNASGFYGRNPYVCPDDEKHQNLNKIGAGNPEGTYAERLMYFMQEEFVKRCDFHLDLHSGDATEALLSFCAIGNSPIPENREMVHHFAHYLNFDYHTQSSGTKEFYNASAVYSGVPSMMFECGGGGKWFKEEVEFDKDNILRIAQLLDILPGKPERNHNMKCIRRQSWIECGYTGFFYTDLHIGDDVKKGQLIYEIRDAWGNLVDSHYAEYDGKIFILNNTLGVTQGDDAVFYGSEIPAEECQN